MPRAAQHRRIAADIERRIAAGEWPPGTQLPSRADLGKRYGVHEQTIRLALIRLRERGIVESRGARLRMQVAHTPVVQTLTDPDAPWPHRTERTPHGRIAAPDEVAERLDLNPGVLVQRETEELLDALGRSSMHVTTWWRGRRRPHVSYAATVDVVLVNREQAAALRLPVDAVALRITRTRFGADGVPTETSDIVLPRDRWRLRLR